MFTDKSVLVTGATGSFGQRFVHKLVNDFKPKRIVVYSRDELKQHDMQHTLPHSRVMRYFLGDVRDCDRLAVAMEGIDYVVHAAALKQVPAAEYNPIEFIKTNVHGAENIVRAALNNNVEKVIALSTDKAVEPVNLYGATKMVSDRLFVSANNISGSLKTRFSVVRYGNVIGSRGSVIPLFKKLLDEGATELPITDENMTRFWLTIDEGVQFVIDSFKRMTGGEVFIPKLSSVNITDIAKAMAPSANIKVIGIRPGEKLHESLCSQSDARTTQEFDDFYIIQPPSFGFFTPSKAEQSMQGGKAVASDFKYQSDTNPHFLTLAEVRDLLS